MKTLKEVKEKLEDIRGGGVDNKELNSYTEYNNFFIENYNEIFDYIEDNKIKWDISLHSIESVFEQVIEDFSRLAIDFIEENTNEKDTENINILIDYVKNKYIYFGNFDKKIIKEFVNKLLEKEIILYKVNKIYLQRLIKILVFFFIYYIKYNYLNGF